jgi:prepilin-type N-terminal cleavage/methylation domain-containing protein/prepilin-type processing-associated H-X9-DG protein
MRGTPATRGALRRGPGSRGGFTLIEVLIVVAIVALLAGILSPSLSAARQQARAVACRSNLRELFAANRFYADEHGGVFVPGASEFVRNLQRWHGRRDRPSQPFDPRRGPLSTYLGPEGLVRQCPSFDTERAALTSGGFERGCGGYGYNNAFVGVQLFREERGAYVVTDDQSGTYAERIARPADTVMFTDSAFAARGLIEYSFAEPRFHPQFPESRMDPSIHFRHGADANVAWCDGHVDAHRRTFTWRSGLYPADPNRYGIGWFGETDDNALFDLQ